MPHLPPYWSCRCSQKNAWFARTCCGCGRGRPDIQTSTPATTWPVAPPPLQLPPELFVCASGRVAELAGFRIRHSRTHPSAPHLRAWWPDLDTFSLSTQSWRRITVDSSVFYVTGRDYGRLRDALVILQDRIAIWGAQACWVGPRSL